MFQFLSLTLEIFSFEHILNAFTDLNALSRMIGMRRRQLLLLLVTTAPVLEIVSLTMGGALIRAQKILRSMACNKVR